MPAGTTLSELVNMLREETGRSVSAGVGQQETSALQRAIRRTQYALWLEHDWPHLNFVAYEQPIDVGQDMYALQPQIAFERINEVACYYANDWFPVSYGIELSDLNAFDPDQGETSAPIRKWEMDAAVGDNGYRIWPKPSEPGMLLRFKGQKKLNPLVANSDMCTLDDELIVMTAAANILERQGSKDAQSVRAIANRMLTRLRAGGVKTPVTYLAGGAPGAPSVEPRRILRGGRSTS